MTSVDPESSGKDRADGSKDVEREERYRERDRWNREREREKDRRRGDDDRHRSKYSPDYHRHRDTDYYDSYSSRSRRNDDHHDDDDNGNDDGNGDDNDDDGHYRRRSPSPRRKRRSPSPRRRSPTPPRKSRKSDLAERDRRTVFVQQLAARLKSKDLIKFFEQAGEVRDASIVKDRVTNRSKGVGYVEFTKHESVVKAINMTGQKLLGIPVIVQYTESEKNRQAIEAAKAANTLGNNITGAVESRIYVGNIHFKIAEDDLKEVFKSFGEIESVHLQKDQMGRSKGFAFVQ